MSQSRKASLVEVCTNLLIGFIVAVLAGQILYPLHGAQISLGSNVVLTVEFTIISLLRGYAVRRWFNSKGSNK